ncbi:MAG: hypothetical protein WBD74_01485, partial [Candidatus Aquilonibacter sp.]
MKITASILAIALCTILPLAAVASDHTSSDSSSSHTDPAPAPVERSDPAPAPVERSEPAPVERTAPAPVERTAPEPVAPSAPTQRGGTQPIPRPPAHGPVQTLPPYQARVPSRPSTNGGGQPTHRQRDWSNPAESDWNDGVAWQGVDTYWGDGFWGPLAAGLAGRAYVVAPGSPGAQLLQTYGLTQTPCGPPNLVEIFGPADSEICAFPNDSVAPGVY